MAQVGEPEVSSSVIICLQTLIPVRPANAKELFNLRHAKLRNVIERIFGVSKRRFRLMNVAPEYDMQTQAKIPCALAALHNFIRVNDPDDLCGINFADEEAVAATVQELDGDGRVDFDAEELGGYVSNEERQRANAWRDGIAQEMWDEYVARGEQDEEE